VTFPLTGSSGMPLFAVNDQRAELVVRIHDKEGHVEWAIPASISSVGKDLTAPR
jgi:hypothetical protein